jgi:hypothetical protein
MLKDFDKGIIRNDIQLLDRFPLYIGLACGTENVEQAGSAKLLSNEFSNETNLAEKAREFLCRSLMRVLILDDKSA